MKRSLIDTCIVVLLAVVMGGIVVHAPMTVFVETHWPSLGLLAKSWKEILLGVVLLLLIVKIVRQKAYYQLIHDKVIWLVGLIALVHLLLFFIFENSYVSEIAGMLIDLRMYLFFAEIYVAYRLIPGLRRPLVWASIAGATLFCVVAILQVTVLPRDALSVLGYSDTTIKPYLTVDLNDSYVRINSTLRGPNPVGAYAGMILLLLIALLVRRSDIRDRWQLALIAVISIGATVGLWSSYSRSAWLGTFVGLVALLIVVSGKRFAKKSLIAAGVAAVVVVAGVGLFRESHVISNLVFHSNPTGGSLEKSDQGHANSLVQGVEASLASPAGHGIGSTGSASLLGDTPVILENQYLYMAHESGWVGLALQLGLFGLVLQRAWHSRRDWISLGVFASGICLAVIGLLLPVWVDDTVAIVWWGLAGLAIAGSASIKTKDISHERTSHKKANRAS